MNGTTGPRRLVVLLAMAGICAIVLMTLSAHALAEGRHPVTPAVRAAADGGETTAAAVSTERHSDHPHDHSDRPHDHTDRPHDHTDHPHDHKHKHDHPHATNATAAAPMSFSIDEIGLMTGLVTGIVAIIVAFAVVESGRVVNWRHDIAAAHAGATLVRVN